MTFLDRDRVWLMDGAMGTQLLPLIHSPPALACLARANLTHGNAVRQIHAAYARAGAEIHLTNTFGANPLALAPHGIEDRLEEIARAAIAHGRQAVRGGILLGDVGPIITPGAKEEFADRECLLRTLDALDGVDGLLFETCATPAALAAVEFASHRVFWLESRPLLLSVTYRRTGQGEIVSLGGHPPELFARHAFRHKVSALGVNCGIDMRMTDVAEVLRRYRQETDLPLFVRASAGLPGEITSPEQFALAAPEWLAAGAGMIGGCCGTTADHIAALARVVATGGERRHG